MDLVGSESSFSVIKYAIPAEARSLESTGTASIGEFSVSFHPAASGADLGHMYPSRDTNILMFSTNLALTAGEMTESYDLRFSSKMMASKK